MSDLVNRLRGYNPPDRTVDEQRQIAQDIHDAAAEIERLAAYAGALEAAVESAYNAWHHGTGADLHHAMHYLVGVARKEVPELDHQRVPGAVPSSDNASHSICKSEEAGHASGPTTPGRPTDGHRAPIAEDVGSNPTREATISQSGVGHDPDDLIDAYRDPIFVLEDFERDHRGPEDADAWWEGFREAIDTLKTNWTRPDSRTKSGAEPPAHEDDAVGPVAMRLEWKRPQPLLPYSRPPLGNDSPDSRTTQGRSNPTHDQPKP